MKTKILGIFILFFCAAWPGRCEEASIKNFVPAFKAEIAIIQDSLWHYLAKDDVFTVDTTITNISEKDQDIAVWTQQGLSWVSNNPIIVPDTVAFQNINVLKTLKPGEKYKGEVILHVGSEVKGPVTFRLGFFPKARVPISFQPGIEKSADLIWSNPMTFDRAVITEKAVSLGKAGGY